MWDVNGSMKSSTYSASNLFATLWPSSTSPSSNVPTLKSNSPPSSTNGSLLSETQYNANLPLANTQTQPILTSLGGNGGRSGENISNGGRSRSFSMPALFEGVSVLPGGRVRGMQEKLLLKCCVYIFISIYLLICFFIDGFYLLSIHLMSNLEILFLVFFLLLFL